MIICPAIFYAVTGCAAIYFDKMLFYNKVLKCEISGMSDCLYYRN
jgi:hypothetical protein